MKKTLTIMVLALFLVSLVPVAFAQEATDESTGSAIKERIKERAEARDARQETRATRTPQRETRGAGKEVSAAVRARIQEHKKAFAEFRAQLKDCKGQKTPECEDLRKQVRTQSKLYLKDTVQDILTKLKDVRAKTATAPISDQPALQELDNALAQVEESQKKVDALPDDASTAQVQEATKDVQEKWKNARRVVKVHEGRNVNFGVHGVLVRAEKLEKRLDKTLERLKAKGVDTKPAEPKVTVFKEEVKLARENADKAKAKFDAARKDKDNFETLVREGHAFLAEARIHLKKAHAALKEAVRAIKGLKDGAVTLAEETAKPESSTSTPPATTTTPTAPTTTAPSTTTPTTPPPTEPTLPGLPVGAVIVPVTDGVIDTTSTSSA